MEHLGLYPEDSHEAARVWVSTPSFHGEIATLCVAISPRISLLAISPIVYMAPWILHAKLLHAQHHLRLSPIFLGEIPMRV